MVFVGFFCEIDNFIENCLNLAKLYVVSVPAKAIWRTIGPAPCQFGPKGFEKI